MAKGYQTQDLKQKLVEVLSNSKTGLSGVEISEKLGINRVTMAKYLNIFATEGMLRQKNIGNVNLWFIEEGTEQFEFPDDYFHVKTKYLELLTSINEQKVYNLIRNCIHSNANPRKNVIIISADCKSALIAESASASFHSEGWNVSSLGDMSDAIDVIFDLDLQQFLGKVWTKKNGIMIIVIFSETDEGLKFFSQAVNSVKEKFGKNLNLVLCSKIKKNILAKADLIANNLETVLQWSETTFEHSIP